MISATALLAVRRASSYSVPLWFWCLCMRLLATGPWAAWVWGDPWVWVVSALRVGTEVIVLEAPHPCFRGLSAHLESVKKHKIKNAAQKLLNKVKGSVTEARKVSRIMTQGILSQSV